MTKEVRNVSTSTTRPLCGPYFYYLIPLRKHLFVFIIIVSDHLCTLGKVFSTSDSF